jgi:hypothetical protein
MNDLIWVAVGLGAIGLFPFGRVGCGMGSMGQGQTDELAQDDRSDGATPGVSLPPLAATGEDALAEEHAAKAFLTAGRSLGVAAMAADS